MKRVLTSAAMLGFAAQIASAQIAQFSAAKAAAQKAAAAENRHIAAEQQPDRQAPSVAQQGAPARVARVATRPPQAVVERSASNMNVASSDTGNAAILIMREQYGYARDGRRDPFFSLIATNELRPTMSDLRLTGILYDQGGGHSVATLRDVTTDQQYRVSTGTTLGRMLVSSIRLKSIVFTIDEFGATRQDSLVLGDTTQVRKR